jgi:hypothetical protein
VANISRAELRNRVLQHLCVLAAGEDASAEDASRVDAQIVTTLGELQKWGVPAWGEADNDVNLLRYSEDFTSVWSKLDAGDTITANALAAPDGTTTADALTGDASNGNHGVSQTAVLTAASYTLAVWAKPGDKTWLYLSNDTVATCTAYFNIGAGVGAVGTVGAGCTASITEWNNGWYRCAITFTGTAATHTFKIQTADANADNTVTGDATTVNTYLWGAQVALATVGTRYTPTTAEVSGFDSQVIPDFAQDPLRDLVASKLASTFGLVARIAEFAALGAQAEQLLRRHVAAKTSYTDTKEELAYLALQAVGYIVVGEIAPPAALQAAKDAVDYEFARLQKDRVINFTTLTIPDRVMGPLADIIAYSLAPRLGRRGTEAMMELRARSDIAFGDLKSQIQAKSSERRTYVEYF